MSLVINGVTKKETYLKAPCDTLDLECVSSWMEETVEWSRAGCKAQLAFENEKDPSEAEALQRTFTTDQ